MEYNTHFFLLDKGKKQQIFDKKSILKFFDPFLPVDTGRKLNVNKTFRKRPGRLLNVLCTFNLRPASTGKLQMTFRFCVWKVNFI